MAEYRIIKSCAHYPAQIETRKRRDAAALLFERLAYETVAGFAGLDTRRGVKAIINARLSYQDACHGLTIWFEYYSLRFIKVA